jgi:hypothetical protein
VPVKLAHYATSSARFCLNYARIIRLVSLQKLCRFLLNYAIYAKKVKRPIMQAVIFHKKRQKYARVLAESRKAYL